MKGFKDFSLLAFLSKIVRLHTSISHVLNVLPLKRNDTFPPSIPSFSIRILVVTLRVGENAVKVNSCLHYRNERAQIHSTV